METISIVDPADWITIWHSEMAALAVDRECAGAVALWGQAWVDAGDLAAGRASADAAAGSAPAGPASDVGRELD